MDDRQFTYHTAPNGLRMVHRYMAGAAVDYCGVTVNAGSRDEDEASQGLAHFVEHTIFKGTVRRRSWHIINRMEAVGGELNAYTTKEETVIYTVAPAHNLRRSVDLIADLIINSTFPQAEIDREREVVADEINSYLDTPSEAVFDDFEDMIFAGSSLGHNILGTTESIARFTSADCRRWLDTFYTPGEMVFFYTGAMRPHEVFGIAERYLGQMATGATPRRRVKPVPAGGFNTVRDIGSHQAHTVIGALVPGANSPRRHAVAMLTNILGGPGMNSMLNVALRERRGLVYAIDASTSVYSDCGLMTIYFGCDPDDTRRCRRLVMNIIDSMARTPLTRRQLERARRQYLGQLIVAGQNSEQLALSAGRAMLVHGRARTPDEIIETVNAITPDDILDAARLLVDNSTLTLA